MNATGSNKSLIIQVNCGLGNQLFMYAFGRALSLETGKTLLLDKSIYLLGKGKSREYLLEKYNTAGRSVSFLGNFTILRFLIANRFKKYLGKEYLNPSVFKEPQSRAFVRAAVFPEETIYSGFWQSPAYFEKYKEIIHSDLTLKKEPVIDSRITEVVRKDNSVSIHFRRTDYVPIGWADACPREYYQKAVSLIEQRVENPRYFIFSDDAKWVKTNYSFGRDATYCSSLGIKDYEELYLMSQCKHHINANSTFSWWGAYLSKREGITVAPKKCLINWDDGDNIYLPNWEFL